MFVMVSVTKHCKQCCCSVTSLYVICNVYLPSVAQKFECGYFGYWGFGDLSATEVLTVPRCTVSRNREATVRRTAFRAKTDARIALLPHVSSDLECSKTKVKCVGQYVDLTTLYTLSYLPHGMKYLNRIGR